LIPAGETWTPRNRATGRTVAPGEMTVTTRLLLAVIRMAQVLGPARYRLSCRKAAIRLENRLAF